MSPWLPQRAPTSRTRTLFAVSVKILRFYSCGYIPHVLYSFVNSSLISANFSTCHTYENSCRNSFPCHTYKNKRLKALHLPHIFKKDVRASLFPFWNAVSRAFSPASTSTSGSLFSRGTAFRLCAVSAGPRRQHSESACPVAFSPISNSPLPFGVCHNDALCRFW
jgi:hypothetical protein